MNDFKYKQILKFKEGDSEKEYPLYDLNVLRGGLLYTDDIPKEIPEQIKLNSARVSKRLSQTDVINDEPIALVGYGPTLKVWWKQLHDYKYIMSTSGAHKFLLERDIVPTYHVDVDFRERKAIHTNPSHPDIKYLMAVIVHPKTIDNVIDRDLTLWNLKLSGVEYPKDEFVVEAYWDVGQEAIMVAKALGYRKLHLFGYDYAFEVETGITHAGFHNGPPGTIVFAKIGERFYHTSDSLARGVIAFTQIMKDNTDLDFTIYSDGLLSAYLQQHYPTYNEGRTNDIISPLPNNNEGVANG